MTDSLLYPSHIAWRIDLQGRHDVAEIWGRDISKRVAKAKERLAAAALGYRFERAEVTDDWLKLFVPLYNEYIGAKDNAAVYDVRGKITAGQAAGKRYEAISLWKHDVFLGGVVYSVVAEALQVAYRVFPRQLDIKLPISCSYVGEDYLFAYAFELGKKYIIHGRDRNPYGINGAIGLAEYKLKIGCAPFVSTSKALVFNNVSELKADGEALVFLGSEKGAKITQAILVSHRTEEGLKAAYGVLLTQQTVPIEVKQLR